MSSSKRVLIYRRGALGDTLLTFPLAEVFKNLGYEVIFCGNTDYLILAKLSGLADEIISSEFFENLCKKNFDRKVIISKWGNLNPFPKERMWLPEYYLKSLSFPLKFSQTLYFPNKEAKKPNLAILHPGSGSPKKNPPLKLFEKIEAFLKKEGFDVIYLAGEAENWLLSLKSNLFYSVDILEIANFLKRASLFIGNDSGISHLSGYLGIHTFVFFGPSDEIIFRPIGERVHIIKRDLPCRPCFPEVCEDRPCFDDKELFRLFIKSFQNAFTSSSESFS
ncbi:MAG: glycosyltransferase family 9 protein [Caldimicrobium sp.]